MNVHAFISIFCLCEFRCVSVYDFEYVHGRVISVFLSSCLFYIGLSPFYVEFMLKFSLIPSFIISFQVQPEPLKGYGSLTHGYEWFRTLSETIKNNIANAGFGHFVLLLQKSTNDLAQIQAFSERWWDTTNTFHMSFGEMTMTPLDFSMITGLRFGGRCLELIPDIHTNFDQVRELLGVVPDDVSVPAKWLFDTFADKPDFSD